MRHRKSPKTPGRTNEQRKIILENLATSLILHERLETTVAKARAVRPFVERLISSSRTGTLAARRRAESKLTHKNAVRKLFEVLGPKYKERPGGYTRIRRTRTRVGDSAELAVISFVE